MADVRWERNKQDYNGIASRCAGWVAYVADQYVGIVYVDGDAYFGPPGERETYSFGSQPLAAQALVRYVEAGGR